MGMAGIMFVPTVLFMIFVAPLWVIMHYRSRNRSVSGLSEDDLKTVDELLETADRLADRVDALEKILDDSVPDWRKQQHDRSRT